MLHPERLFMHGDCGGGPLCGAGRHWQYLKRQKNSWHAIQALADPINFASFNETSVLIAFVGALSIAIVSSLLEVNALWQPAEH